MFVQRILPFFLVIVFSATSSAVLAADAKISRRTPVVAVVEKVGPAVVNIRTEQIVKRRSIPLFGFGDSFILFADQCLFAFTPDLPYRYCRYKLMANETFQKRKIITCP